MVGAPLNSNVRMHEEIVSAMSIWAKFLWLAYALFHLMLSIRLYRDNVDLGYPGWVVYGSAVAQLVLFVGILIFAFAPQKNLVAPYWRWIVPLLFLELIAGIVRDAVVPGDFSFRTHGVMWVINLMFTLALFAPAYYASIKLSRYGAS